MRMHLVAFGLVFVASAAAAFDVKSPGPGWEEANRDEEAKLVVFTKDDPSGARKIIAVSEVEAKPETVFRVVTDFDNYPKFMPYVKESRTVKRISDRELLSYALLVPPLIDDRDYVIHVTMTPGTAENGGVFKSEWTAKPEAEKEREDVVRVKLNNGSWTMEPLDGGRRTRLTYTLHTHPGGSIPDWMANKSNTVALPDLFAAVKKRSAQLSK